MNKCWKKIRESDKIVVWRNKRGNSIVVEPGEKRGFEVLTDTRKNPRVLGKNKNWTKYKALVVAEKHMKEHCK